VGEQFICKYQPLSATLAPYFHMEVPNLLSPYLLVSIFLQNQIKAQVCLVKDTPFHLRASSIGEFPILLNQKFLRPRSIGSRLLTS